MIQMKGIRKFYPNDETHKAFGDALRAAAAAGVHILAYDCIVTENSMDMDEKWKLDYCMIMIQEHIVNCNPASYSQP